MDSKITPKNSKDRSKTIVKSGYLFIAVNFLLGVFNIIVGLISGSLAITSDAVHSFIDSVSGFLIIICEKLASHKNFTKHRAKIERITTVIIALIIIAVGIHIIVESFEEIFNPEDPDYSAPVIIVLLASIALKYLLASYLKRTGKAHHSTVLTASGAETMTDTWISVAVLFSAIFYLLTKINLESYISIIIALIIIKIGLEFIFPKISSHHHHFEQDPSHGTLHKK